MQVHLVLGKCYYRNRLYDVSKTRKVLISGVKSIDFRRLQLLAVSLIQHVIYYWSVVDDISHMHNLKRLLY